MDYEKLYKAYYLQVLFAEKILDKSHLRKISCKSLQKTITFPIPASMWMTVFPVEISKGPHFSR